ncbi:MAG: hypothetical protein CUN53_09770, partial [Phototrophicales bacterium]
MKQSMLIKRLLLIAVLLVGMAFSAAAAFAQEGEAAAAAEPAAEAATNPLTPLGLNTGFLVSQILHFLIIFVIVSVFLWRPLMNMLDSRAAKIQKGL